jgi:hypothetical protein
MTTMATEQRQWQVGDRVRGNNSQRVGTIIRDDGERLRVNWTEAGRSGALGEGSVPRQMVTLVEAASPAEEAEMQHGFRVGQRVRSGNYGRGTVIPHPPGGSARMREQYVCVRHDDNPRGGFYGNGQYVIVPSDLVALDEPDEGSDESAADEPEVAEGVVQVGDHVDLPGWGTSGRVVSISARGEPLRYDNTAFRGSIEVRHASTGEDVAHYPSDVRFQRRDDSPIPEVVNEPADGKFVGQRVHSGSYGRDGVVVSKADRTEVAARYKRHRQWAAVVFDGDTTATVVQTVDLALVPETPIAEMDDAVKLRALQVMIHRVASYEAVRREWCDEVNTALRGLGDLLPADLRAVNRTLGQRLRDNPMELFDIDAEVPEDVDSDPEPAEPRTFDLELVDLEYSTDAGYRVTDASVGVQVTVEACDCGDTDCIEAQEIPDPNEWAYSDQVTDDQIRDAIRATGLPEPSRYADFSYSDGDWTES